MDQSNSEHRSAQQNSDSSESGWQTAKGRGWNKDSDKNAKKNGRRGWGGSDNQRGSRRSGRNTGWERGGDRGGDRRGNRRGDRRNNHRDNHRDNPPPRSNNQDVRRDVSQDKAKSGSSNNSSWAGRLNNVPQQVQTNIKDGRNIRLKHTLILWCHDIYTKSWRINSFKKLYTVETVADFWKLFNNFNKLGPRFNHYFLMKAGSEPTWEHSSNRNGGICKLKTELRESPKAWLDLNLHLACGILCDDCEDINGISISPKNDWAVINIWNRNRKNDLSKLLNKSLLDKYGEAMTIRYTPTKPEH